jgi:hypothetical protein
MHLVNDDRVEHCKFSQAISRQLFGSCRGNVFERSGAEQRSKNCAWMALISDICRSQRLQDRRLFHCLTRLKSFDATCRSKGQAMWPRWQKFCFRLRLLRSASRLSNCLAARAATACTALARSRGRWPLQTSPITRSQRFCNTTAIQCAAPKCN